MSDKAAPMSHGWTPPKKKFSRIDEFRSVLEETDDLELAKACQGLLRDKMEIANMTEMIEKLEKNLYTEPKRNFFSFFVEGLSPDEILALADKCGGRVKILEKKAEKQAEVDAANKSDVEKK